MRSRRISDFLKSLVHFSASERRGLIAVGILAALFIAMLYIFPERTPPEKYTAAADSLQKSRYSYRPQPSLVELNSADSTTLISVPGIGGYTARMIIEYRQRHGRFDSVAQLKSIRSIRPENLERILGRVYVDTALFGHFPKKQISVQADQRSVTQGYKPVCIDINSADSVQLVSVSGIGAVLSRRIADYRDKLGGFADISQLREIKGMTDDNFLRISTQIFADSAKIKKIDINFASVFILTRHPYIGRNMAVRIDKGRKLKGGYNNLQELTDSDILLPHEAQKIRPYVVFGKER